MWPLKTKKQCSIRNTVENSLAQRFRSFASAAATEGVALSAPLGAPEDLVFETENLPPLGYKRSLFDPKTKDGALNTLHYLNLRFIGVGFRGYIIKKVVNVHKLSKEQKKLASRWLDKSEHDGTSFIRILILKLGQSALTAYPIPVGVTIYCPTDQQQQADNQPLLLTSTDYQLLTSVISEIKSYKIPDVYKGSGVFLCERLETEKGEQYLNETTLRKVIKKK